MRKRHPNVHQLGGKNLVDSLRDATGRDDPYRRLKDWEALAEILCTRPLTKKEYWPNDWHQDCGFVAFLLHNLETTLEELNTGKRIVLPKTKEHAVHMIQVAEATIKSLADAPTETQGQ
jgi:hypothetical protein